LSYEGASLRVPGRRARVRLAGGQRATSARSDSPLRLGRLFVVAVVFDVQRLNRERLAA